MDGFSNIYEKVFHTNFNILIFPQILATKNN